jgi:O-antigen ligase
VLTYFRENIQIYFVFIVWLLIGIYGGGGIYVVIPITMILMKQKGYYEELLLGYLFILILSDSLDINLVFAKNVKNIYIVMLSVFVFFDRRSFSPLDKLHKIFVPFFIFSVFTMSFSIGDPFIFTSLQKTVSFILSFFVIPNFVTKLYREQGQQFFRNLILFMLTTLLLGFVLKFISPSLVSLESGRYRGVLGNPNGLGIYAFLMFVVFFVLNDFFPDLFRNREKTVIYAIILVSIFLTNSRNAILAVLIFYSFQRFFSLSPFLGFVVFIVALFFIELITNNLTSILMSLGLGHLFRINTLEDGSGRYIAWEFAWKQIQYNFFIGKGFAYNEFYMRQHYDELGKMGHQGGIHNSFLTFWMDQGLIGLIVYLRSYILMFIKAAKKTKFAFPIMFSITFTAIFESWLVGSLSAFAFLAMLIFTIISSDEIALAAKPKEEDDRIQAAEFTQTPLINDY